MNRDQLSKLELKKGDPIILRFQTEGRAGLDNKTHFHAYFRQVLNAECDPIVNFYHYILGCCGEDRYVPLNEIVSIQRIPAVKDIS